MTTTTFLADSAHQFVNWNDPARWSGGVVPNSPAVDVIIPKITANPSGATYVSFVQVTDTFTVSSLSLANNYVILNGAGNLTVAHDLTISDFGEIDMNGAVSLSAGSIDNNGFDIQGSGTITTTGLFLNETAVFGSGLNLTAGSFTNVGALNAGGGNLTVTVTPGGFTNLSGSTLSGGTYRAAGSAASNDLSLNVGSVIDTDAADIQIDFSGTIYSYDDVSHAYVSLASSLHSIAGSGKLFLGHQTYNWSNLTVDGSLTVSTATLNTTGLTVDSGGKVFGIGTIGGPIVNNGTIIAGPIDDVQVNNNDALLISGTITGSGTIEIASARITTDRGRITYTSVPLELAGAVSSDVFFDDGRGTLKLDDYADFTGKIRPAATGDAIILKGVAYSSVTSYAYSGDSHQGTLAIQTAGGEIDLQFLGNFDTASFFLFAGPKPLSSDPDSLQIGVDSAPTVLSPIAEDSGARLITQAELLANFVGSSPVATGLAITSGLGVLVDNHDGTWSYTPAHDDSSAAAFSYQVTYSTGTAAETATLDITPKSGFDFNDDGKSDIFYFNDNGSTWLSQINGVAPNGGGTGPTLASGQHIAGVADFDGDHKADLLIGSDNGTVTLDRMNGAGVVSSTTVTTLSAGWHIETAADFNGDGKADILFSNDSGALWLSTMDGAAITGGGIPGGLNPGWHIGAVADFDGDGKSDILYRNDNGQLWLNEMNGAAVKAGGFLTTLAAGWHIAASGDFDGDGRSDLLFRNDDGRVWLSEFNGFNIKGGGMVTATTPDWHVAAAGDYNGDGKSDILWQNDNGALWISQMNGAAITGGGIPGQLDPGWHLAFHHFDVV
jgi:hypothetical protein